MATPNGGAFGEDERVCAELRQKAATVRIDAVDAAGLAPIPKVGLRRTLYGLKQRNGGPSSVPMKVVSCCWHSDSKTLFTADQGGTCVMWDAPTRSKLQFLSREFATSIAVSPSACAAGGKALVAVGGMDNTIVLGDMSTAGGAGGAMVGELPESGDGHDGLVSRVRFVNEAELVSAGGDGELRLWDVAKRACTLVLRGGDHGAVPGTGAREGQGSPGPSIKVGTKSVQSPECTSLRIYLSLEAKA